MKIINIATALALAFSEIGHAQESPLFSIDEALTAAKSQSATLRSAEAIAESATSTAEAADSALYPKLSIDGSYKRQSVIPEVSVGGNTIKLNDYYSYSIGPTLSYTLWDSGLKRNQMKSLEAVSESKQWQRKLTESQVMLSTKVAYVQASLAAESLAVANQANELSRTQNKDIQARHRGGSASRLDALTSDSEVLNYNLKVQQADNEWQSSQSDLNYLVGKNINSPEQLQSMKTLYDLFKSKSQSINPELHPLTRIQNALNKSALAQAEGQRSAYWPTLNLQLRSSLDYPNGSTFEQINQNSAQLNLTWSLFEFGATKNQVAAKLAEARASAEQMKDVAATIDRDAEKAKARVKNLVLQIEDAEKLVLKQQELARLNYSTYKFGKLSFSDVQTANLRLLEAKTRLASLRAQFLIQTFNLQYLSESE